MKLNPRNREIVESMHGRVLYVLILVVVVQLSYPITIDGSLATQIIYQIIYASLLIAGISIAREARPVMIFLGVLWLVTGTIYAFNQDSVLAQIAGYGVLVAFLGMILRLLLRFIFVAREISLDVLYAASAAYMMLGSFFVPIYGIAETVTFAFTGGQHAFNNNITPVGVTFPWQDLVYFSFVTLTTLGYGDILAVTMWSRALVSLQAVIGVLYVTVIMARLVSLYASREIEEDIESVRSDITHEIEESRDAIEDELGIPQHKRK